MKFPLDLAYRVSSSLSRAGYCILRAPEIERLFARRADQAKESVLQEFAIFCGGDVAATPHFKSAHFTRTSAT